MKKLLIYTSAASLALLAGVTTTVLLNNASAEPAASENAIALNDQTALGTSITPAKNETIYVITDAAGAPTKTFIGNVLDTAAPDLPLELKITYSLDGKEISAADLAHKSGHVKITFDYTSTKTYQGQYIPFLALTGLSLDDAKFTNITVTNGKIIEQSESQLIAGYAVTGLNQNLGTDILPSGFTIEADVTDFELGTTYTLATDELFAEIDTSKLNSIDELVSSMTELESGISQILDGATSLDEGVDSLVAGIEQLQSGASALNDGASQLAESATGLNDGLASLSTSSSDLNAAAMNFLPAIMASGNPTLIAGYQAFLQSLGTYTGTVDYIAGLTPDLVDGTAQLSAGADALKSGIDQLADGAAQLSSGSKALKDGIATFKRDGIDQLVNFANNDVESFLSNFRSSVSAAKSYHSYKSTSAETVKFIFKTPSIK